MSQAIDSAQSVKTYEFNAEVSKVLKLVIHSLYTNEDIFLRELISNASDACDKLRYISLTNQDVMSEGEQLKILITSDKDSMIMSIRDNGIGMNQEDLINNIGMIAHSGTQKFIESIDGKNGSISDLIGQFGVGFYSVFMVAEHVTVKTRKFDSNESLIWKSNGDGKFSIELSDEEISRGTEIILKLKEDKKNYLDRFHIEHIVTTYSDYVGFDIELVGEKENEKLNSGAALWRRNKNEITQDQYNEFFRSVAHVGGEPLMIFHNKNEGSIEYTNLLFIPTIKPFDLFHPDRRCSVKLYVNRVFITEDNVKLIPQYLRFIRGIVDSYDLPLNISRETLQNNAVIGKIRTSLTKRILDDLKKLSLSDVEKFQIFWDSFGSVLKEGLCESIDTQSREKILSICKFNSALNNTMIGIDQYIENMKENQNHIFFITADNIEAAKKSPQIEGFLLRGIDVLILCDPVDDFWTSVVSEYKDKNFKSVGSSEIDLDLIAKLPEESDSKSNIDEKYDEDTLNKFTQCIKEILGDMISSVIVSKKLQGSPVCLSVKDGSMNARMERILIDQKQMPDANRSSKVFEINIKHPIIKSLLKHYQDSGKNDKIINIINMLFVEACIVEGEEIKNKIDFVEKLNTLLHDSL